MPNLSLSMKVSNREYGFLNDLIIMTSCLKCSSFWTNFPCTQFLNKVSLACKCFVFTETDEVNTQRSFYVESGRYTTRYLRILRLCFAKPFYNADDYLSNVKPIFLNYATFEPRMVSSGGIIGIPIFESMAETMKKAMHWLNKTRPGQWRMKEDYKTNKTEMLDKCDRNI